VSPAKYRCSERGKSRTLAGFLNKDDDGVKGGERGLPGNVMQSIIVATKTKQIHRWSTLSRLFSHLRHDIGQQEVFHLHIPPLSSLSKQDSHVGARCCCAGEACLCISTAYHTVAGRIRRAFFIQLLRHVSSLEFDDRLIFIGFISAESIAKK
jgi:hypothetical protein